MKNQGETQEEYDHRWSPLETITTVVTWRLLLSPLPSHPVFIIPSLHSLSYVSEQLIYIHRLQGSSSFDLHDCTSHTPQKMQPRSSSQVSLANSCFLSWCSRSPRTRSKIISSKRLTWRRGNFGSKTSKEPSPASKGAKSLPGGPRGAPSACPALSTCGMFRKSIHGSSKMWWGQIHSFTTFWNLSFPWSWK